MSEKKEVLHKELWQRTIRATYSNEFKQHEIVWPDKAYYFELKGVKLYHDSGASALGFFIGYVVEGTLRPLFYDSAVALSRTSSFNDSIWVRKGQIFVVAIGISSGSGKAYVDLHGFTYFLPDQKRNIPSIP
ncbi:MAG: hypothetical protein V3U19_03755 [Thermodesulfobacteriota bacterium]